MEGSEPKDAIVYTDREVPSLSGAVLRGSFGFGLASLAAFSVWAFAAKWFQTHLGEPGMYAACAVVFIASSGILLHPLIRRPSSLFRFCIVFVPAFLSYVVIWCITWFGLGFGVGEWLGALLGSAAFVGVLSWRMGKAQDFLITTLVVFVLNSTGYFLGGKLMHWLLGPGGSATFAGLSKANLMVLAKLAWGLLYGLGFGAGIGYAFHSVQSKRTQATARAG